MAVVRQQQLSGRVRHNGGERPLNDLDHLWLPFGHVQGVGQAALEPLAPACASNSPARAAMTPSLFSCSLKPRTTSAVAKGAASTANHAKVTG